MFKLSPIVLLAYLTLGLFVLFVIFQCVTVLYTNDNQVIVPLNNIKHKTIFPILIHKEQSHKRIKSSSLQLNYTEKCRSICAFPYSYEGAGPPSRIWPRNFAETELVCPTMFRDLADFVWHFPFSHFSEIPPTFHSNYEEIARCFLPGAIIYAQTGESIQSFTSAMAIHIEVPFIFITGQSDYGPNHFKSAEALLKLPKLIAWFAQNVDLDHPKLIPIPIGLNCHEHGPEMVSLLKSLYEDDNKASLLSSLKPPDCSISQWKNDRYCSLYQSSLPTLLHLDKTDYGAKSLQGKSQEQIATINFGISSNVGLRQPIKDQFCTTNNSAWLKCSNSGQSNNIKGNPHLIEYYKNQRQFTFVFSPFGNGLDCHRSWEAMYLGSIPILQTSRLDVIYAGMPVIIVKSFEQVNEPFLRHQLSTRFNSDSHEFEQLNRWKLTRAYWVELIFNTRRKAIGQTVNRDNSHYLKELDRERRKCFN
jgi:hypothetical protein